MHTYTHIYSYIQTQGNIHTYKHTQIITSARIYTYLHTHRKLYIHRCVWILQLNQRLCNFLFSFCKSNCNPFSLLLTLKCKLFSLLDPVTHSFFFLLIRTNNDALSSPLPAFFVSKKQDGE